MAEWDTLEEDVLGDGRLLKRILTSGRGSPWPRGTRVHVRYDCAAAAGDDSPDASAEEHLRFVLGDGDVAEAWDIGVATMCPGERSAFTVADASLVGRDNVWGRRRGSQMPWHFTLELLLGAGDEHLSGDSPSVSSSALPTADTDAQRLERGRVAKGFGNRFVQDGDLGPALKAYEEALRCLKDLDGSDLEVLREANSLRLSCLLNMAFCDLRGEDFAAAARHASAALDIDPRSSKALFRRGVAHLLSGRLAEAKADLLDASRLEPHSAEIRARLQECKEKVAQASEWNRAAFGGMFGRAQGQQVVKRSLANLPRVWLDVQIGDLPPRRLYCALYKDTVPRTAENFRALCTGERGLGLCGQPLHFRRTLVHRVVAGSLVEAGDIEHYDGSGGESIYGPTFADEGFGDSHHKRGLLCMANRGPNTNGSRFFITLRSLPQFDGKHVVFGEIVGDSTALERMEAVETRYPDKPVTQIAIVDSGQCQHDLCT